MDRNSAIETVEIFIQEEDSEHDQFCGIYVYPDPDNDVDGEDDQKAYGVEARIKLCNGLSVTISFQVMQSGYLIIKGVNGDEILDDPNYTDSDFTRAFYAHFLKAASELHAQ